MKLPSMNHGVSINSKLMLYNALKVVIPVKLVILLTNVLHGLKLLRV